MHSNARNAVNYSPIAPIKLLTHLYNAGILGDYLLLLAHDVLDNEAAYIELLSNMRAENPAKQPFIILDNSLVELGHPMKMVDIRRASSVVNADVIILPDCLRDARETIKLSFDFLNSWDYRMYAATGCKNPEFMAVIQGVNVPQLVYCASALAGIAEVTYWGIPRILVKDFGSRMIVDHLVGLSANVPTEQRKVHLLGMSDNLADDIFCAGQLGALGIDSANPLVQGQKGIDIRNIDYGHGSRKDFWDHTNLESQTMINISMLREQIAITRGLCLEAL